MVRLLVLFLASGLLTLPFARVSKAGKNMPDRNKISNVIDDEEGRHSAQYYSQEVMERFAPKSNSVVKKLSSGIPEEFLPRGLRKGEKSKSKFSRASKDVNGKGTGGWTNPVKPYTPSSDPDINYDVWSGYYYFDSCARRHYSYCVTKKTDVTAPGDPGGPVYENCADIYYALYDEGEWSAPVNLTGIASKEDTALVDFYVDSSDYFHIVYSKWTWGKDPTYGPGTGYQHEGENLWYRYRTPSGSWSSPVKLTNFSGKVSISAASFVMVEERLYVAFYAILNKETSPSSYTAYVCALEGDTQGWTPVSTIEQWDYTNNPGQLSPTGYPLVDASRFSGEVSVAYEKYKQETPGSFDARVDIYYAAKEKGGNWESPQNITNSNDNEGYFIFYGIYGWNEPVKRIYFYNYSIYWDATHPPCMNFGVIRSTESGWEVDLATDAQAGEEARLAHLLLDPWENMFCSYVKIKYVWAAPQWTMVGSSLMEAHEWNGSFTSPVTLHPYQDDHYFSSVREAIDPNGGIHVAYSRYKSTGGADSDFQVFYCANLSPTDGEFAPAVALTGTTDHRISKVYVSCNSQCMPLVSWFDYKISGAGVPEAGALYSRRYMGASLGWLPALNVTEVPGSSDIVHVDGINYLYLRTYNSGEQVCIFETAKYNTATSEYYDFHKYFAQTNNLVWGKPELISDIGVSGEVYFKNDANNRIHVDFYSTDPSTGKDIFYASMQPKPTPPSCTYYFAEGTTRSGFNEWISIQNPNDSDVGVQILYMLGTGEVESQELSIGPKSRATVSVKDAVGEGEDVSAQVTGDLPIVAERPIYFNYRGWTGGHDAMGAIIPYRRWFFAEGTTRDGFSEYLTIQNPSGKNTKATITYMLEDGSTKSNEVELKAHSRTTVEPSGVVGLNRDVSVKIECTNAGIICERPMYFNFFGKDGGHNVMGGRNFSRLWYFAEGATRSGFDEFLCLYNPTEYDGEATITYILGEGTTKSQEIDMPKTTRKTVRVNDAVGPEQDVSVKISSTVPILAERPMYFNYLDIIPGGTVSMGARAPKKSWFFAEGTTRNGFTEWLSIQNPGDEDAGVTLSFMMQEGSSMEKSITVPKKTRVTVNVNSVVGLDKDVSLSVWATRGIIVERPMYFGTEWGDIGGTDVLGL